MRQLDMFLLRILPVLAVFAALSAPAFAGNYTALSDKELKAARTGKAVEEKEKPVERVCVREDEKNIESYAKRLEKFSKDAAKGAQKAGEMGRDDALRKSYMKIHNNFTEYLKSEDYEKVKESYKVCGVEMPKWDLIESFWAP